MVLRRITRITMQKRLLTILGLIGFGIAGRLLPHIPNATPITSITLAGNKYIGRTWAIVIPLVAMLVSDAVIGFYDWRILLSVYISFALIGAIGSLIKKYTDVFSTMLVVIGSSLLFFLVTNFTVWMFSAWYEKSLSGLLYCYFLGLPFLRNMLMGDVFFSTLLLKGPEVVAVTRSLILRRQIWTKIAAAFLTVLCLIPVHIVFADSGSARPYLDGHAQNPWVTMAQSVLGESPDISYLRPAISTSAIDLEAPILAFAATRQDPTQSPFSDYVAQLKNYYTQNQIGDPTLNNDDIFGILALVSSGVSAQDLIVTSTISTLLGQQNADGGWSYNAGGTSDTNTTAAAIMALKVGGHACDEDAVTKALVYLHVAQNADGGFPYDPKSSWGTASDASSDSWIIMALNACSIDESLWSTTSSSPKDDLLSYQTPSGYFEFQHGSGEDSFSPITTSYAVIALSGETLPVAIAQPKPDSQPAAPTPTPSGGEGGGVVGGGPFSVGFVSSGSVATTTTLSEGQVLGTSTQSIATTTAAATTTASTATPQFLFQYDLRYGMTSEGVSKLQQKLIKLNLLSITTPSGWFGPLTLHAVKEFQNQNEIPTTGFVGPMTRKALNSNLAQN